VPISRLATHGNAPNPSGVEERILDGKLAEKSFLDQAIHFATTSRERLVTVSVSGGTFAVLYLTFVICEGVYGYGGPDAKHAFYIEGLDTPALSLKGSVILANDLKIDVKEGYPVDMAKVFRAWFLWGFWGSIVQILIVLTFVPIFTLIKDNIKVKAIVFASVQGLACCSTILWFIMGLFWRFSQGGRIVAGEKLERTAEVSDEEWKE